MKKMIKTMLIAVVISIAIIVLKNEYSPALMKKSNYGMPALIEEGYVDKLFIGSSMFKQGLDVNELKALYGDNWYVLAYNGNQPVTELFVLEHLINSDFKLENVYVDMYAYSAFEDPDISDEKIFMELDLQSKSQLFNRVFARDVSPSIVWRSFVTANNEEIFTWPINSVVVNSQFYRGGSINKGSGNEYDRLISVTCPGIAENMNMFQKSAILKMSQLSKDYDFKLCFIETPKFESVETNENYISAMEEYRELLDSESIEYISEDDYEFDNSNSNYFADILHLSGEGSTFFTKQIINRLEQ